MKLKLFPFMTKVSMAADCGMVLDIGHLIGYQQASGRSLTVFDAVLC